MTGRTKTILVLVIGGIAGFLLFRASDRSWGSTTTGTVGRTFQTAPIQTGDLPTFQMEIGQGGTVSSTIEIPQSAYQAVMPRDSYERKTQAIPFLGIQAYHHKASRDGNPVAEWVEGLGLLYGGVALAGLALGAVLGALIALVAGALGLKKAPNV